MSSFIIDERPGQEKPFVIVEKIKDYSRDLNPRYDTRKEAEDWIAWATYTETENAR